LKAIDIAAGHCSAKDSAISSNDEALEFLSYLAEALGRSLAREDNEQELASYATEMSREEK
jgi:hypothetical protein